MTDDQTLSADPTEGADPIAASANADEAQTPFTTFELTEPLQRALARLEFNSATPVQAAAIPSALEGADLMVSSKTGSGKTVAFLAPAITRLVELQDEAVHVGRFDKRVAVPQVLVLCPTRELAQQVARDAISLVRELRGVRIGTVTGGVPFGRQLQLLRGAQLVVATPGRLLDLAGQGQLSLDDVDLMVLDEADRMLDLGFQEALEDIDRRTQDRKQTLMFSATFAGRVESLAAQMMNKPERIDLGGGEVTNTDIRQILHWVDNLDHKQKLLEHWLTQDDLEQAVVFASTQEDTDALADALSDAGHNVVALHGGMPQSVRNRRIQSLRDGKSKILVATDVAARGLDVPGISHVINYGLPMKNEDYVHRIGRTGRAGRKGQAITLASHRDRRKIKLLEDYLEQRVPVETVTGLEPTAQERPRRTGGRFDNDRPRRPRGDRPAGDGQRFGRGDRPSGGGQRFGRDGTSADRRPYRSSSDSGAPRPRGDRPAGDGQRFSRDGGPRREMTDAERQARYDERRDRPARRDDWSAKRTDGRRFESTRPRFEGADTGSRQSRSKRFDRRDD